MLELSNELIEKINESFLGGDCTDDAVIDAVKFAGVYGGFKAVVGKCESLYRIYQDSPNENSGFVGLAAIDVMVKDINKPYLEQTVNWVGEVFGKDIFTNVVSDLADFINNNPYARCVILAGYQGIDLTRTVSYHTGNVGTPEGLLSQVLANEHATMQLLWAIGYRLAKLDLSRKKVEREPIHNLLVHMAVFNKQPDDPFDGWESLPTTPLEESDENNSSEASESVYERFVNNLPIIPAAEKILSLTLKEKGLEVSDFDMSVMTESYVQRFVDVADEYVFEAENLIQRCGLFGAKEQYVLEVAFAAYLKRNVVILNPLEEL